MGFENNWDDYQDGFGNVYSTNPLDFNVTGEYWLGLNNIHTLCNTTSPCHLRVDLRDPDYNSGNLIFSEYSSFGIKGSNDNYRAQLSGYNAASSTAGDALLYPDLADFNMNNMAFTTKDSDHDMWSMSNCAQAARGGWWFNVCGQARLNSLYNYNGLQDGQHVLYDGGSNNTILYPTYVEMKVRLHE